MAAIHLAIPSSCRSCRPSFATSVNTFNHTSTTISTRHATVSRYSKPSSTSRSPLTVSAQLNQIYDGQSLAFDAPQPPSVIAAEAASSSAHPRHYAVSATAVAEAEAALRRVVAVSSWAEYDRVMAEAARNDTLVVVETTVTSLPESSSVFPHYLTPARASHCATLHGPCALFLRVFADRGEESAEIAGSLGAFHMPSYAIFREGQMVHIDTCADGNRLQQQLEYYSTQDVFSTFQDSNSSDNDNSNGSYSTSNSGVGSVVTGGANTGGGADISHEFGGEGEAPRHGGIWELQSRDHFFRLLRAHSDDDRLVVVMATSAFCNPCVGVHASVAHLAEEMAGRAVFARVFGDADESANALMRELNVIEAPTFLFYRRGELVGRFVGSSQRGLVKEVVRHQRVLVS